MPASPLRIKIIYLTKIIIKTMKINRFNILLYTNHNKIPHHQKNVVCNPVSSQRVTHCFLNLEKASTLYVCIFEESQPVILLYNVSTNLKLSNCFPMCRFKYFYQEYCIGDACLLFCHIRRHLMSDQLV